jgi:hypothetical protein
MNTFHQAFYQKSSESWENCAKDANISDTRSSGLGRPNYNWPTHVAPSVSQPKTLFPALTSQTSAKAKNDRKPNVKTHT